MRYTQSRLLKAQIEELESANMLHQKQIATEFWKVGATLLTAGAAVGAALGGGFVYLLTHHL